MSGTEQLSVTVKILVPLMYEIFFHWGAIGNNRVIQFDFPKFEGAVISQVTKSCRMIVMMKHFLTSYVLQTILGTVYCPSTILHIVTRKLKIFVF